MTCLTRAALAALLFVAAPALAQEGPIRVNVDVQDADLATALERIGNTGGATVLVDPRVEETITVNLRDIPWREAVDVLARMTRCEVERRPGYLYVHQPARVTLELTDTEASKALELVATFSGENLVFAGPDRKLSAEADDAPWREALQSIADAGGFKVQQRARCTLVSARPLPVPPRPARLRTRRKAAAINVDVADETLPEILQKLSVHVRQNVVGDPALSELTTVAIHDLPWDRVVDVLAERYDCRTELLPGNVLYMHRPQPVTLSARNEDVRRVLRKLAAASRENLIIAPDVRGRVSVHVRDLGWDRTLEAIAAVSGLHLDVAPDHIRISAAPVKPAQRAALTDAKPEAKPLTLDLQDADLADVMEQIGERVGVDILVDPNVEASVTVYLRELHWLHAVQIIARITGCQIEQRQGILLLTQPPAFTIQARRAPADALLRLIGSYSGRTTNADGVQGTISTDLADLHMVQAVGLLADAHGCSLEVEDEALTITPGPTPPPVEPTAAPPSPLDTTPAAPEGLSPEERKALTREIDQLFAEIEQLSQDRQVEELIGKFTELRQLTNAHGKDAVAVLERAYAKWESRLQAFGEVQLSIQLQLNIGEGNHLLRSMASAIKRDSYADVLLNFERIKELKDEMYAQEREVFHRNAEALYLRGKALIDRARELRRIAKLPTHVTAIVLAPTSSELGHAALINGHSVREGDPVLDAAGKPIPDLKVTVISRSLVRLSYEGTSFVRELPE